MFSELRIFVGVRGLVNRVCRGSDQDMSRRVRQRMEEKGKSKVDSPGLVSEVECVDWINLTSDAVIEVFTRLNRRDRANLAATCKTWRSRGASSCLWKSLDLRAVKLDLWKAAALSKRCVDLERVRFRGLQSASAILFLRASKLREIRGENCMNVVDATLCMLAARHQVLESLELGPDSCEKITSEAIKVIASCCPKLKKLLLSGVKDVSAEAITSLAKHCSKLSDLGFLDCEKISEEAIEKLVSVRYLSVAGTSDIDWLVAADKWVKLPNLKGLDVSRTNISPVAASSLLESTKSLKVFCSVNCSLLTEIPCLSFKNLNGTIVSGISSNKNKPRDVFAFWRKSSISFKDERINEIMRWIEWSVSHTLLRIAESNSKELDNFWFKEGVMFLLSLMQSSEEDVQERAVTGVGTFIVVDGVNATTSIDSGRVEAVIRAGGIKILLELAKSRREYLQSEAAKTIANLSMNPKAAKVVSEEGGIGVLAGLAKSTNRLVAEEAAGGLWNLSVVEEYKSVIAQTGGAKALVELIVKWHAGCDGLLERAAGALANLAADEECSMVVAEAGGVDALVKLARNSKYEGVQEQAARALANLAAHGDNNDNNLVVGQEDGAVEILVQLTQSPHDGVKQEAAGAIWNLSFNEKNRETVVALGGVKFLVALTRSSRSTAFPGLQERAAGALWGLSVSEEISIAIGNEGGIPPLVALARSNHEDVHETAAGALWNLSFNPKNALRIVEEGGVFALGHLCQSSASQTGRFMAVLALAYIFDGRMIWNSALRAFPSIYLNAAKVVALAHIDVYLQTCVDAKFIADAAVSFAPAMLAKVLEKAQIEEAGHLRCSSSEIGRFVSMLRNPSPKLKACAAFALLQFTIPGTRHAMHHASLIQATGEARVLRSVAAATSMPREGKVFAKIVIRNLEHHQAESSKGV